MSSYHNGNSPSRPQHSRGNSNPNVGHQESRRTNGHTSRPVWEVDNTMVYPEGYPVRPEFSGIGVLGGRKIVQKADGNYYLGELATPFTNARGQQNQQTGASDREASEGDHQAHNDINSNAWDGSTSGHRNATFFENSTNIVATGGHFAVYEGDYIPAQNRQDYHRGGYDSDAYNSGDYDEDYEQGYEQDFYGQDQGENTEYSANSQHDDHTLPRHGNHYSSVPPCGWNPTSVAPIAGPSSTRGPHLRTGSHRGQGTRAGTGQRTLYVSDFRDLPAPNDVDDSVQDVPIEITANGVSVGKNLSGFIISGGDFRSDAGGFHVQGANITRL